MFAAIPVSHHSLLPNLTPFLTHISKSCFASAKKQTLFLCIQYLTFSFSMGNKTLVMTQTQQTIISQQSAKTVSS